MSTQPDRELHERIDTELRRILDEHHVADLPAEVSGKLDEICARDWRPA
jgi:hypothetical protein